MPTVELLFWRECPSYEEALAQLRAAMAREGLDPDGVAVTEVADEEAAVALDFHGSPTIRIDGADPFPPGEPEPVRLACRLYWLRDGRPSPTPDPADLAQALAAARGA